MIKIYRIKLEHDLGYANVHIADNIPNSFGDLLFSITNAHSYQPEYSVDHDEYIIAPSIGRLSPPQKSKTWKFLNEIPLKGHESTIYFKNNISKKAWKDPRWEHLIWHSFSGFDPNGLYGFEYSQISHLPFWTHIHPDIFITRVTMVWMKKLNITIEHYYEIDKLDWQKKATYYEVINTPFYDEIKLSNVNEPIGNYKWKERTHQ